MVNTNGHGDPIPTSGTGLYFESPLAAKRASLLKYILVRGIWSKRK
jgi:hypothetical protein